VFKIWLATVLPVDRDILHVAIGAVILFAAFYVLRPQRKALFVALIVAALAAVGMEVMDIRDTLRMDRPIRWQLSVQDVIRTVLFPVSAVLVYTLNLRFRGR